MSQSKYYLTTPLYYVNAKPHIGHAYTTVAADVLARFKRLLGFDVLFLTGTDEHGQKVQQAADARGLTPKKFADELSAEFRKLWDVLNISYDDFIRTTEDRHIQAVQKFWIELESKNQIFRKKYEGWYCTPCEAFWAYRDIGHQTDKVCPQCSRALQEIQEENFFFKLSEHREWLIQHIEDNSGFIQPESRKNETLVFLKNNELLDLCISRPKARLGWGIESPLSPEHVTYVWFDALINYVSALGYPQRTGERFLFWPADVHFIGKDILRPHTVYWPIMLHAIGLEPPKTVFAHGWWMVDQAKMSKSLGNVVNPMDVVAEYGVDAFRFFMLREVTFGQDGTYSDEAMTLRYNVDLANDFGNLLHRTLSMMEKYFNGVVPANGAMEADNVLRSMVKGLSDRMDTHLNISGFSNALDEIWKIISAANKFVDESAPWNLKKQGQEEELKVVMTSLYETLRIVTQAIWPFMPQSAEKIWTQLGLAPEKLVDKSFMEIEWNYVTNDTLIAKGTPIFPRREKIKAVE